MTVVMFTSITEGFLIGHIHYPTESPYQCVRDRRLTKYLTNYIIFLMFKNANVRPTMDP